MDHSSLSLLHVCTLNLVFSTIRLLAEPIVGGFPDEHNVHNHHVTIYEKDVENNYHSTCGATIISEKHVLTAAHCFMSKKDGTEIRRPYLGNGLIKVITGTSRLHEPGVEREIIKIFIPDRFNMGEITFADVAVAELESNLDVSNSNSMEIRTMGGPFPLNYEARKEALICGFGATKARKVENRYEKDMNSIPQIKQCLIVMMKGRAECLNYASTICARNSSPGHTTCYGDSGGGLIFEERLIGVLSQGPPDCHSNSIQMTFTRTSLFQGFINRAMDEYSNKNGMHVFTIDVQLPSRDEGSSRHPAQK